VGGEAAVNYAAEAPAMGRIVIVAYRPKPGQRAALESLVRRHHARLLAQGLVTDRAPTLMRAADGAIVEVFEWISAAAIAAAHDTANVQQIWSEYSAVCDYVPLAELPEARELFAEFEPLVSGTELHPELSP
jgi:hypothetical protein